MTHHHHTTRRGFLAMSAAGAAMLVAPSIAFASAATDQRFVFIIQRGAADGLHLVPPVGDPNYVRQRGALALDAADTIKLDSTFSLHPALGEVGRMYGAGEALLVHAVASRYRDRSHFDAQNVIETGGSAPYQVKDGWLNRLAGLMPIAKAPPIAFAPTVPIALRGPTEVTSYAASKLPKPGEELLSRMERLYEDDPQLHALWSSAMQARALAGGSDGDADPASLGRLAASFLSREDGPRIAMMETMGWDTHDQQGRRLDWLLKGLDDMLASLRVGMGEAWSKTTVLVVTEFGRTVAVNGTAGTDHGTASAAMLLGGAVNGGRVLGDWPGLAQSALYEGRDLHPTTSLEGLIAATAAQVFNLDPEKVARTVANVPKADTSLKGLIRG